MQYRITDTSLLKALVLTTSVLTLSACSSSDDNLAVDPSVEIPPVDSPIASPDEPVVIDQPILGMPEDMTQLAFTFTRAADFGSGRIDRLSITDGNTITGSYPATLSDNAIVTDGTSIYQIGRFNIDSVTRFDALDTSVTDFQISVIGDNTDTTNPQDLVFIDDTKAYLTRRNSGSVLIVDPTPESDQTFAFGEIDISDYDTDFPNATDAIIVDDKLFVLMERLNDTTFTNENIGYVAVFDTRTDTEINTLQGFNGLNGIALSVTNPTSLQYNAATNSIYVVGRGNFFENAAVTQDFHSGGIEVIDPTTYVHSLILDDGTDESNEGFFIDAEVITPELGYLLTNQSFGVSTLRTFNPTTGELAENPVGELENVDITTLALGPNNNLWVGINDATPGFILIDTTTGDIAQERVSTELIPTDVVFLTVDNQ